ncbi:hypothetical protein TCAL_13647, partial [Tigriopus californicus]
KHFDEQQFLFDNKGKRRLKPTAIPTIFSHTHTTERVTIALQDHEYAKKEAPTILVSTVANDVEPMSENDEESTNGLLDLIIDEQEGFNLELTTINHEHHMTVLELREMKQVCQRQAKLTQSKKSDVEQSDVTKKEKSCMDPLNTFLHRDQLVALDRQSMRGLKWIDETIKQGLQLKFACDTSGYETLLKQGYPLQSVRTLLERTEHIEFEPGILDDVFEMLKLKAQVLDPHERLCCLTMDEFADSTSIDFDTKADMFVGYVTLTGHSGIATKCLVFQVNGLCTRFKQIVAYHFTDVPHILKNLRGLLCSGQTITLPEEIVKLANLPSSKVCLSHLQALVNFDEGKSLKVASNLTKKILAPSHFDKMSV